MNSENQASWRFDLHCHPTTKSFLTGSIKKTPWDKIKGVTAILKSQSNLTQLFEGKVKLAVITIVPIELGFSNCWLIKDVVGALTALDRDLLTDINYGIYSFNQLFWDEIAHLKEHLTNGNKSVKLLKSIEEFEDDENVLNGIMGIEGSHFLFNRVDQECTIMEHLHRVKNAEEFSFLHLNLTHLTWNSICNHAYGAKITYADIFKPIPDTMGISELGYEIIDECYSTQNGKRILIDVKHMSLFARKKFYDYRKTLELSPLPPILATHVGVTGFSWNDIADKAERTESDGPYTVITYDKIPGIGAESPDTDDEDKGKMKTYFNPWSINLYNEDIREIVDSDGLMGIILDQRILGVGKVTKEYFGTDEYNELVQDGNQAHPPISDTEEEQDDYWYSEDDQADDGGPDDKRINKKKHLRYLCNTLLHIFKAGATTEDGEIDMEKGKKAWKHICIGSDFDGLINPVNNCKSAADFPQLEQDLPPALESMMEWDDFDYPEIDLTEFVQDFMYNNAKSFLDKYFNREFLTGAQIS